MALTVIDDFNRSDSGTVGNGWTEFESSTNCVIEISSNRSKITRPSGPGTCYFEKDVTIDNRYDVIMRADTFTGDNSLEFWLRNKDTGNPIILISVTNNKWSYDNGSAATDMGVAFSAGTDYDISFRNVDNTAHTLDVWIDDNEILTDLAYWNNEDVTRVRCRAGRTQVIIKFDDVTRGEDVGLNPKVKVSGTFSIKKTLVKIGGNFAEKPVLVKVSGTFQ